MSLTEHGPRPPLQGVAERRLADQLHRWRIRGDVARRCHQPRAVPFLRGRRSPEIRDLIAEDWLAGYDGRTR
jgi:hypothetical protein